LPGEAPKLFGSARGRPRSDARNGDLGAQLRRLRRARRLSQGELGERIGVTSQQIHRYESGKSGISALALWDLARALDVSLDRFFGLEPAPEAVE
jgi:transcriptional regulator with XRE-family HTH domain